MHFYSDEIPPVSPPRLDLGTSLTWAAALLVCAFAWAAVALAVATLLA